MSIRISLENLTVRYSASCALDGVSLAFDGGSIVSVFGENGAGKSTLLWVLSGLLIPSAGRRTISMDAGRPPGGGRLPRIGFLAHQTFLYEDLTVEENLNLTACLYGLVDGPDHSPRWIDRLGLADVRRKRVAELSRGQVQRAALARSVLPSPDILLLDEPFSNLDSAGVETVAEMIVSLQSLERIIVMATHDRDLGLRLATSTVELAGGKVVGR